MSAKKKGAVQTTSITPMVTDNDLIDILEAEIRAIETERFAIWHYLNQPTPPPMLIIDRPPEEE